MPSIDEKGFTFFSGLNSLAMNASGDLAAACFNDREILIYRIVEGSPELDSSGDEASLEEIRFIRLPQGRYDLPAAAEVNYRHSKLAFLNDETLLVAREIEQVGGGSSTSPVEPPNVSLAAIDLGTGQVVTEFTDSAYGPIPAAPVIISPNHVLFAAAENAMCLDTTSYRILFRLREFDENGAVIGEEGASGGEQIMYNAVAYDRATHTLHVLWGEYTSSFLQTYRVNAENGTLERLERRPVLEDLEGNSLCLRPDGNEIAVWGTVMDGIVDCRTDQGLKMPERVRLGRLEVFSPQGDRYFDVYSEVKLYRIEVPRMSTSAGSGSEAVEPQLLWGKGEFSFLVHYSYGPGAEATEIGIRYGVDQYASRPFYLDDRTVVINTPGGILLGVDTITGESRQLMEMNSPICDLCVHHAKRQMLIGARGNAKAPGALTLCALRA